MAGHPDLPKNIPALLLRKADIFDSLKRIDNDAKARNRILAMETEFRGKIGTHIEGLPNAWSKFAKFFTNPFVLMCYSKQKAYSRVSQIEQDLVPAKVFSSMETSAGNMVEKVVLPIYGWDVVPSAMHSHESLLDGRKVDQMGGKVRGSHTEERPSNAKRRHSQEHWQRVGRSSVIMGCKLQYKRSRFHLRRSVRNQEAVE